MNSNNSLYKHKTTFELLNRLEPVIIQSGNQNEDLLNVFKEEFNRVALSKEDWANDLKVTDEQAEKLRNEIRNLKQTLQSKGEEIQSMKKALSNREVEINRLQATMLVIIIKKNLNYVIIIKTFKNKMISY